MSVSEFSRDPSDYRHGDSGHSRRRRSEREIPDGVIAEAIESGDWEDAGDSCVKFTTEYIGYNIHVVVNTERGVICTAFGDQEWKDAGL